MTLSSIAEWTIVDDQTDGAHALSRSMTQEITAGGGKGKGARPRAKTMLRSIREW